MKQSVITCEKPTSLPPIETTIASTSAGDVLISESRELESLEDMPKWRLHDLRRTVASGLARMKTPQIVIEKIQNRATGEGAGVAGVYNRYSYMEEREAALAAWARHVESLVDPCVSGGDVIELQDYKD